MLLVLFNLGDERFGVDARDLTEILPSVPLRPVMGMPAGVAGLLLHRDALVPVIDLELMTAGQPCEQRLSTRILLAPYQEGPEGALIGLRVGQANDTLSVDPAALEDTGLRPMEPPAFGPVLRQGLRTIQLVKIEQLLSEAVRASLFAEAAAP